MDRSRLFWLRKALDVLLRTIFFGMMGYCSWTAILDKTHAQGWVILPIAWILLISSVVTPAFMIYHFMKTGFSPPSDPGNPS
jgi:hypothetical protein